MKNLLGLAALLISGAVNAAAITYTDSSGSIRVNGYIDSVGGCYSDATTATPGSLASLTDVVSSGTPDALCGSNLGAVADGALSAITSDGFSISGTVSAFMHDGTQPGSTLNDAKISRDVSFTLAAETEIVLDMDWSGCVDCINNMYMGSYFSLKEVGGSTIDAPFFEFISPNFSGTAGSHTNSYVLGPGDYQISMDINGQAYNSNGSSGEYTSSISVSVVPIPAAVWLFGSALAGLGWMRRKRPA